MITRETLKEYANDSNVSAFLHVIREGETSQAPEAYQELYGGSTFESFADHPRQRFPIAGGQTTSAAGAYQFEEKTWDNLVAQYGFPDFSPASQDQAAVALLIGRKALLLAKEGRVNEAVRLLPKEWTSLALPRRIQAAPQVFVKWGGVLADQADRPLSIASDTSTPQEVKPVGIFAALLPSLLPLIPQLGALFGSGSEVSNRNIAAASAVTKAITEATNSPNLQAAIETMQGDPEALKAGQMAVHAIWDEIAEVGSGGIDGARKSIIATAEIPLLRQPAFVLAIMFFGLIGYVVILSMLKFDWIAEITPETRAGVIMFVLGTIGGGIVGMYYGTMHKAGDK